MNSHGETFTHYDIPDGLVKKPKADSMYHIKYQEYDVTITFAGKNIEDFSFYDFTAGYGWIAKSHRWVQTQADYVSKESLPPSYRATLLPPIMLITSKDTLKTVSMVNRIEVSCNDSKLIINTFAGEPSLYLKAYNQEIQESYQKLVKVPVTTGEYPIFLDDKIVSAEELQKIYADFIASNPDEKLNLQYQASDSSCHMRAKVVIDYLRNVYDLNVLGIIKIYDQEDWKGFKDNKGWTFHYAALPLSGAEKTPWVWDSWVGLNKKLLTIPEWVYRRDEPTPKKVIIINHAVINDFRFGKRIEAPHFFEVINDDLVEEYKKVATSTFSEYPLATNGFSFFKAKAALKDQKEHQLETEVTHKQTIQVS